MVASKFACFQPPKEMFNVLLRDIEPAGEIDSRNPAIFSVSPTGRAGDPDERQPIVIRSKFEFIIHFY